MADGEKIIAMNRKSAASKEHPAKKHETARQAQARLTKERIYNCADKLFSEKGYDDTTIVDIAEAAGVSVGGFYYHFKSKDAIMRLWVAEFDSKYLEYYENELCSPASADINIIEKLILMVVETNKVFSANGCMLSRLAYSTMLREKEIGDAIVQPDRGYYRIISELVEVAKAEGFFPAELPSDVIIQNITIICRGCMVEWLLQSGRNDLLDSTRRLLTHYFNDIRLK